jgi:hypothetical protein
MAAKQKPAILKSFFEGHRRKAFLADWKQTRDRRGIDTIKIEMRLPLLNESVLGMNQEIGDPFSLMAKNDSKTDRAAINAEIKGMTLEAFSTGTSKEHWVASTGTHFKKLWITAEGEEDKKEVNLHCVLYVPGSIEMRDWAWIHCHKEFYVEAVYSQSEMDLKGELEDIEDEEEKPAEKTEPPPLPSRPAKKTGPKELKDYHETQVN